MSAPNTDIERQQKNHWGPLSGISLGLITVAVLFVVFLVYVFASGDDVGDADETVDGRTGTVEDAVPVAPAQVPTAVETVTSETQVTVPASETPAVPATDIGMDPAVEMDVAPAAEAETAPAVDVETETVPATATDN